MVQTKRASVAAPAEPSTSSDQQRRPAVRVGAIVTLVAVAAAALLLVRLGRQQADGPAHIDMEIGSGIPATLYVPGKVADDNLSALPDPKPVGQRPPVIVLAHGFAADRALMSTLARSLTNAGYAVVAFDFRGHGANRNAFGDGDAGDGLRRDIKAVVDWTQTTAQVDPTRLIVMGHSMGASAVLDFATHDRRPMAVVPISGGDLLDGAVKPKNVFLIAASGDPKVIRDRDKDLVPQLERDGANVERSIVPNTDHITILYSGETVKRIVHYTDGVLGIQRTGTVGRADGRLGTAGLYMLAALVLIGAIGVGTARLAPAGAAVDTEGTWRDMGIAFVAFFGVMPLLALGSPIGFLPLVVGDNQGALFFLAGAAVLLYQRVRGQQWRFGRELRAAAPAIALAVLALYLLLSPMGQIFHRLVPTPERLVLALVMPGLYFPFNLVLKRAVRRGSPLRAGLLGALSKVLVLVAIFIGLQLQLLPFVLIVILPVLAGLFLLFEVFADAAYAAGRNLVLIAAVQAAVLGWVTAASLPIKI